MRYFIRSRAVAALILGSLALVAPASEIKPLNLRSTPALKLRDLQDNSFDLGALRGRVVLINFWATWCEPCREEMPALERLRTKLKGRGFELVTVNYGETNASVSRFVAKLGLDLPVLLDPGKETANAWKVRGLPMTFLVDAKGKARFSSFGEQEWSDGEPLRLVESLLTEAQRAQR